MKDYFELLGEVRRPWLEPAALKQKFLDLSAQHHPDRVHRASEAERKEAQQRFTELNAAYNRLRDPKDRLLHLLELELGARPPDVQDIPDELLSFFSEVREGCRDADALLTEKGKVTSPLLSVQVFDRAQEQLQELALIQQHISSKRENLLARIQEIDRHWGRIPPGNCPERNTALQQLEELYRLLSYFTRWLSQLQDRITQLAI